MVEVENKKKRVYGRESEKVTNKTKKKHKKTYNYKPVSYTHLTLPTNREV